MGLMSIIAAYASFWAHPVATETGITTIFAQPGDRWAGGPSRCLRDGRDARGRVKFRKVRSIDNGVALRGVPCGAPVRVCIGRGSKRRCEVGIKLDGGPYGAVVPCEVTPHPSQTCRDRGDHRWCIKTKAWHVGTHRGVADLTDAFARRLRHNGYQRATVSRYRPRSLPAWMMGPDGRGHPPPGPWRF